MEWITKDDRSPFFNQFSHIAVPPYSPEESRELIRKFIPDIDARNAGLLHHYSGGNPFYLVQLLRKAVLFLGRGEEVSESLIKRAFISETLSPNGLIHSYCNYLYSRFAAARQGIRRAEIAPGRHRRLRIPDDPVRARP